MATGDFVLFEEFIGELADKIHDMDADTFKLGLISNAAVEPTAAHATPAWADFSANEVNSTAGNYDADGEIVNGTYSEAAGVGTFDATDVEILQNGAGFTDGYWGILYNSAVIGKNAVGYVELGGPVSEVAGTVSINWNVGGVFTITIV